MASYIVWTSLFVVLCIVEANTASLTCIWFALGALVTLIGSYLGIPYAWQIPVFVISSVMFLILTRPLVKKKLTPNKEKTNTDRLIGKTAIVTDSITPDKFAGTVTVGGQVWSAVSSDGKPIESGKEVNIEAIDGVKLVVSEKIPVNM